LPIHISKSEQKTPGRFDNEIGINNGNWYKNAYDKTHNLAVTGSYKLNPKWSFGGNFSLQTGQPVTYPNGQYIYQGITVPSYGLRNENNLTNLSSLRRFGNFNSEEKTKAETGKPNGFLVFTISTDEKMQLPLVSLKTLKPDKTKPCDCLFSESFQRFHIISNSKINIMKNIAYLFILIFFASCEDVINVDLETGDPKLVIDANILWQKGTSGNEQKIKLTTTTDYYTNTIPTVSGAIVFVTNSQNTVFDFIEVPNTGEYVCTNFVPVINETYTLNSATRRNHLQINRKIIPNSNHRFSRTRSSRCFWN
jgi:hypothetical protein